MSVCDLLDVIYESKNDYNDDNNDDNKNIINKDNEVDKMVTWQYIWMKNDNNNNNIENVNNSDSGMYTGTIQQW